MKFAENLKLKTDLKIKNQISKLEPAGTRRETSRPTHVDRAVDRPVDWGVDCPVDLPVDTGCRATWPGCTRSGFLARAGLGSRDFLNLTDLI